MVWLVVWVIAIKWFNSWLCLRLLNNFKGRGLTHFQHAFETHSEQSELQKVSGVYIISGFPHSWLESISPKLESFCLFCKRFVHKKRISSGMNAQSTAEISRCSTETRKIHGAKTHYCQRIDMSKIKFCRIAKLIKKWKQKLLITF